MPETPSPLVAIVMGSGSDAETMRHVVAPLARFDGLRTLNPVG